MHKSVARGEGLAWLLGMTYTPFTSIQPGSRIIQSGLVTILVTIHHAKHQVMILGLICTRQHRQSISTSSLSLHNSTR